MKIKTKKQLNLPQLIEWAWENDVRGQLFPTDQNQEAGIYIATNRDLMMNNADYIKYNNTFTVEVEEEITEDTELDLIERFIGAMGNVCYTSQKMSINKSLRIAPDNITTTHFYIENDDQELVLIWHNGKLV